MRRVLIVQGYFGTRSIQPRYGVGHLRSLGWGHTPYGFGHVLADGSGRYQSFGVGNA